MPTPAEKWRSGYSLSTNRWTAARLAPQTGRVVLEGFWFAPHQYWAATELVLLVLSACTSHTKLFFLHSVALSEQPGFQPISCPVLSGVILGQSHGPWRLRACVGPEGKQQRSHVSLVQRGQFCKFEQMTERGQRGWWCRKEKGWLISKRVELTVILLEFGSLTNVTTWHSQSSIWQKRSWMREENVCSVQTPV